MSLSDAEQDLCTIEVWEDRVPVIAAALSRHCPVSSILQHGKIVGDLVFFGLPFVLPPENAFPLQDITRARRREQGSAAGAVCLYNPRQQICVFYGDDLCDEPFEISYIGEIVGGADTMRLAALGCWSHPGGRVGMSLQQPNAISTSPSPAARSIP